MSQAVRLSIAAAIVGALSSAAHAAGAKEASARRATLFTGVELDNQEGHRLDLGLSLRTAAATTLDFYGSRADASLNAFDLSSTSLFAMVGQDFGSFHLGAGVRQVRDDGLTKTLGWIGSAAVDWSSARLSLSIESRGTDFDDTPFTIDRADLGLPGSGTVSGTSACNVDSLGYGLDLRVDRSTWSWYASGNFFDYSSYDCSADLLSMSANPGGANARVRVRGRPVVERLTAVVASQLGGYLSTRLPYEYALIESSAMVGGAWYRGNRTFGVELYRSSEKLANADTTAAMGYFAFPLASTVSMELSLGASDTDGFNNMLFGGARLAVSLY